MSVTISKRAATIGAGALLVAGGLAGGLQAAGLFGPSTPTYAVPTEWQSDPGVCVSSNQCAACVATPALWIDANNTFDPTSGLNLTQTIRTLGPGTIVQFATDGCYEINGGIKIVQDNAPVSYEGNPSAGPTDENAELYNACQNRTFMTDCYGTDQGGNPQGPAVLSETFPSNVGDQTSISIQDLQIQGHDVSGDYPSGDPPLAEASGIELNGTAGTFINDVSVDNVYGDCLTVNPDTQAYKVPTTNLVVENFSGAQNPIPGNTAGCGRDNVSFESVKGAVFCGTSFGNPGEPEAWNFEDDSEGTNMGSQNVRVTGLPCDYNGIAASGCSFTGFVQVNSNIHRTGNIVMDDCSMPTVSSRSNASGSAIVVVPEGSDSGTIPIGYIRFSNDSFKCFTSTQACVVVTAPFEASVASSIFTLGSSAGNTQRAFDVNDNSIGGTVYGGVLTLASDCFSGYIGNLSSPPYGGHVGTASTYNAFNVPYPPPGGSLTGFYNGNKTSCTVVP